MIKISNDISLEGPSESHLETLSADLRTVALAYRAQELERELATACYEFRGAADKSSVKRHEAHARYVEILTELFEIPFYRREPYLDSQLPDELMPDFYLEYWQRVTSNYQEPQPEVLFQIEEIEKLAVELKASPGEADLTERYEEALLKLIDLGGSYKSLPEEALLAPKQMPLFYQVEMGTSELPGLSKIHF